MVDYQVYIAPKVMKRSYQIVTNTKYTLPRRKLERLTIECV